MLQPHLFPAPGAANNPQLERFIARAVSEGWVDTGEILDFAAAMRAAFPPAPPTLTPERIAEIYTAAFESAEGCARPAPSPVPPLVIEFGQAIERELTPAPTTPPLVTPDMDDAPCAQCGKIGVHLCEASAAQAPAISYEDMENEVIVDRRDLFDSLRAAFREGQGVGPSDTAESWHKATDYADKTMRSWSTLRAAFPTPANGSIRGPLTDAQRSEARALYGNMLHLGRDAADEVIRAIAVPAYVNGFKDAK